MLTIIISFFNKMFTRECTTSGVLRTGSSNIAASAQSRKAVTWKATNKEKMHVNTWAIAFGLSQ